MAIAAARAIADVVGEDKINPTVIVPSVFDPRVAPGRGRRRPRRRAEPGRTRPAADPGPADLPEIAANAGRPREPRWPTTARPRSPRPWPRLAGDGPRRRARTRAIAEAVGGAGDGRRAAGDGQGSRAVGSIVAGGDQDRRAGRASRSRRSTVTVRRPPGTSTATVPVVPAGVAQGHRGDRAGAGAAGQRLGRAPLVDPHPHVQSAPSTGSPGAVNSTFTPAGKTRRVEPGRPGQVQAGQLEPGRQRADQVRVADVHRRPGQGQPAQRRGADASYSRGRRISTAIGVALDHAPARRRPGWPPAAPAAGRGQPGVSR